MRTSVAAFVALLILALPACNRGGEVAEEASTEPGPTAPAAA